MSPSGYPLIAREGWALVLLALAASLLLYTTMSVHAAWGGVAATVLFALAFRDPERAVPTAALAIVSPVDGVVTDVAVVDDACLERQAVRIRIRVGLLRAYSLRCPVEGKVCDLRKRTGGKPARGLWLHTDEGDDVVVVMRAPRLGRPRARIGYGERAGMGQRCAYLRLAYEVDVLVPASSRVTVAAGDRVLGGSGIIAHLVHR